MDEISKLLSNGITAAKWNRSDMFYRCRKTEYDELLKCIVYVCGVKKCRNFPVTNFIRTARRSVFELSVNCIYYIINICDLGQTDLNMFFHFNNVRSETKSRIKLTYSKNKKIDVLLKSLSEEDVTTTKENDLSDFIFPALRRTLQSVHCFNKPYFSEVLREYLMDDVGFHLWKDPFLNKNDFNIVIMYLLIHGEIELSVNTVAAYTHNRFNQLDFLFEELSTIAVASNHLLIPHFSESNSGNNLDN